MSLQQFAIGLYREYSNIPIIVDIVITNSQFRISLSLSRFHPLLVVSTLFDRALMYQYACFWIQSHTLIHNKL